MSLNPSYESILPPPILRTLIKDFNQWLDIDFEGTHIRDLEYALQKFEKHEMYEDCILIKQVLEEKRK